MQGTADFHNEVADTRPPQAASVVDDATALDTAVDVLDAHAAPRDTPIGGFLGAREGAASRLPSWHDELDLVERKRQEPQILEQLAARRQGVRGGLGHALIVGTARRGLAQKEHGQCRVDQQHIFDRVARFLAAITAPLLSRILGALEAPFGAIVAKRGEAVAGACAGGSARGEGSAVGTTRAAAWASATPRRCANACT